MGWDKISFTTLSSSDIATKLGGPLTQDSTTMSIYSQESIR